MSVPLRRFSIKILGIDISNNEISNGAKISNNNNNNKPRSYTLN